MADPNRFVWLDLEMTGLDDKRCHIIELAMIITDGDLNELAGKALTFEIVVAEVRAASKEELAHGHVHGPGGHHH